MLDGPDSPIPIRSGAMHRASGATCGIILRHRYDEVGLPCRKTTGSPLPVSAYDIEVPSSSTFLRGCGSAAEICFSLLSIRNPLSQVSVRERLNCYDPVRIQASANARLPSQRRQAQNRTGAGALISATKCEGHSMAEQRKRQFLEWG